MINPTTLALVQRLAAQHGQAGGQAPQVMPAGGGAQPPSGGGLSSLLSGLTAPFQSGVAQAGPDQGQAPSGGPGGFLGGFGDKLADFGVGAAMGGKNWYQSGLASLYGGIANRREEKKALASENRTRKLAISMGVPEDIAMNAPMELLVPVIKDAHAAGIKQTDLAPGHKIMDAKGGVVGENPAQPDNPSSVDEYNYAVKNGFKGGYTDFLQLGKSSGNSISADVEARKKAAADLGLTPDNPAYQAYILTAKMPREDAQRLTSTDKHFIAEADDAVLAADNVSGQLKQALKLNPTTNYGATAGMQAWAARNDPTGFFDDAKGQQTTDFSNLVGTQALNSMKSIFGANPTEGERAILLELQASVDKTPEERRPILERALQLVERRKQFYKDRADELRGGEFYKKDGGVSGDGSSGKVEDPLGIR
jgi:hypothetical protein